MIDLADGGITSYERCDSVLEAKREKKEGKNGKENINKSKRSR